MKKLTLKFQVLIFYEELLITNPYYLEKFNRRDEESTTVTCSETRVNLVSVAPAERNQYVLQGSETAVTIENGSKVEVFFKYCG